ncbi:MAG: glycosyltransferase family 4 protein [Erysipelotrichaceae bacterium]
MILEHKISINMLSSADKVDGQGVGSAYLEQVKLIKEGASDIFDVRINDSQEADILHVHTLDPMNYLKLKGSKSANVCYCHFLPDTLDGSIKLPKGAFKLFKKYVIEFYNSADYLIVVNPMFMKDLAKYGIKKERMVYIPNYVSKEDFYEKEQKEKDAIRERYGIAKDAFVVIGVGQVQTRKGVLDFIEVAKQMPDVTFVWSGGFSFGMITDGYEELKLIVENPPENVKFIGIVKRTEMNDIYNLSDVLFMPSFNELFPMAILEAVNLKKPLVLRNLELYENILFGKYQMGKNVEDFIEEIKRLKDDSSFYEACRNDSDYIATYYGKENVLKIWKEFYTHVYEEHLLIDIKEKKKQIRIDKAKAKKALKEKEALDKTNK